LLKHKHDVSDGL